jgi:FemAB-related protein (PEP-CTERM system-associated)
MAPPASFAPSATSRAIDVKDFSTSGGRAWDEYVRNAERATFCHLSGWLRVIGRVWRHRSHCIYAERDQRVSGVLPLFHVSSRMFGSILVSTPNAVYGGIVADDEQVYTKLIDRARSLASELHVDYLELRDTQDRIAATQGSHSHDLYVAFDRVLPEDEDELIGSFPRDVRRMARLGVKLGLTAHFGREEMLDDFYQVYSTSVRNLGTPVFPRRLFAEFLEEFSDASDILVVRSGNRVAGAVMSFYFRDSVMPYYGGAYREFYSAGVSNFMYWELMREAVRRGFRRFDFGRSKRGTGSYEFKRGWRMTERELPYKYFLVRANELPRRDPLNPRYRLMIEAWKRLPLGFANFVGPMVVKYLP